ncbi:9693_t:CDS:1 [Paraglomus brasilianum]|uniref:9693_t:CDS:1 n=1 Tax=Paraglomus brasilianum TaxID=144538 RepID=A0A9N9D161_9GLOM|nr:9693_t:CDS:1 [Paraglomus brasilianum]
MPIELVYDVLYEIASHFRENIPMLRSFLLLNRAWFWTIVPWLWSDPCAYILGGQRVAEKSRAFILTFVGCIEDKQQQDLSFKLLHNEDSFNSTGSYINYARYLEELMDDYLMAVVSEALGTDTSIDKAHSLTEALLRHCSLTAVRIKKLTITRSYEFELYHLFRANPSPITVFTLDHRSAGYHWLLLLYVKEALTEVIIIKSGRELDCILNMLESRENPLLHLILLQQKFDIVEKDIVKSVPQRLPYLNEFTILPDLTSDIETLESLLGDRMDIVTKTDYGITFARKMLTSDAKKSIEHVTIDEETFPDVSFGFQQFW